MALQKGVIFPNINFRQPMEELKIEPQTELKENVALQNVLSNSFGFGGNSSSLILSAL
jgi:3-oxoacyl-[acyl-carrier-protein] synthase-1